MDLIPYLIFKTESGQVEFAQWRTQAGDAALAVFQDRAKAEAFIQVSSLSDAWMVMQPALPMLQSIFKAMIKLEFYLPFWILMIKVRELFTTLWKL